VDAGGRRGLSRDTLMVSRGGRGEASVDEDRGQ